MIRELPRRGVFRTPQIGVVLSKSGTRLLFLFDRKRLKDAV